MQQVNSPELNQFIKNNSTLFWDVEVSKLDWTKNKILIIQRVIERGSLEAVKEITDYYGLEKLIATIKLLPYLNKRDIAFVTAYFNIPKNELKCFTEKPLIPNYLS